MTCLEKGVSQMNKFKIVRIVDMGAGAVLWRKRRKRWRAAIPKLRDGVV